VTKGVARVADLVPNPEQGAIARRDVRVSDEDRTAVLDELREHYGAGRLDLTEFEERTNAVVVARYRGELTPLLADLPELHPAPVGPPVRPRPRPQRLLMGSVAFKVHLYLWLVLSVFLLAIYGGVSLIADDVPFWPIFPITAIGLTVGVHAAVREAISD
jgi:Domain of unknown function (DUF1707)